MVKSSIQLLHAFLKYNKNTMGDVKCRYPRESLILVKLLGISVSCRSSSFCLIVAYMYLSLDWSLITSPHLRLTLFKISDVIVSEFNVRVAFEKSNRKAMNRNLSSQKANPALKTKTGNK